MEIYHYGFIERCNRNDEFIANDTEDADSCLIKLDVLWNSGGYMGRPLVFSEAASCHYGS